MKRTNDKTYLDCPICGKPPKVGYWQLNVGKAYCSGRFLKRHRLIEANVEYASPSQLAHKLSNRWNNEVFKNDCANLPVW